MLQNVSRIRRMISESFVCQCSGTKYQLFFAKWLTGVIYSASFSQLKAAFSFLLPPDTKDFSLVVYFRKVYCINNSFISLWLFLLLRRRNGVFYSAGAAAAGRCILSFLLSNTISKLEVLKRKSIKFISIEIT